MTKNFTEKHILRMLTSEMKESRMTEQDINRRKFGYSQLGRKNMYWRNDVNMCHGSKCMKELMK